MAVPICSTFLPISSASKYASVVFIWRAQLKAGGPVKIVAIGSSSTAGEGAILPYPGRLEAAMQARFQNPAITVLNRGKGGQEAPEELSRFESDVIAEAPALVIWQVGTNAVFHDDRYSVPTSPRRSLRD